MEMVKFQDVQDDLVGILQYAKTVSSRWRPRMELTAEQLRITINIYGHITQKMRQESAMRMQVFYNQLNTASATNNHVL